MLQIQRRHPKVSRHSFATTSTLFAAAKAQDVDESLLKMDLDAAEKHMKDWFGDHASWSHDKLLSLVYGTGSPSILMGLC